MTMHAKIVSLLVCLCVPKYSLGGVERSRRRRLSKKKKNETSNAAAGPISLINRTIAPTLRPTSCPMSAPSQRPTERPISHPTSAPSFRPTRRPTHRPTSAPSFIPTRRPSTVKPTVPGHCELAKVPRKSHMECLLATGQCVSDAFECQELGGRFDAGGCGGSRASCSCCYHLPTLSPTPIPTVTLKPTLPYAEGACQALSVPRFAMMRCLNDGGMCLSNARECQEMGGLDFQEDGCSVAAKCGCCTHMPTTAPGLSDIEEPTPKPTLKPTSHIGRRRPVATPAPTVTTQKVNSIGNNNIRWRAQSTASPTARPLLSRDAAATTTSGTTTLILRLVSLIFVIAIATQLFPAPTSPILKMILTPFTLVYRLFRSVLYCVASCCFSFGDGIAEARAPQPLKSMPIAVGDLQMTATSRGGRDAGINHNGGLLVDDAELQAFFVNDDDDDDDNQSNGKDDDPDADDDDIASEEYGKKRT